MSLFTLLLIAVPIYEPPQYPTAASEAGIEAVYDALYDVNSEGFAENICVVCHPTQTLPERDISADFEASMLQYLEKQRHQNHSDAHGIFNAIPELTLGLDGEAQWVEVDRSQDDDPDVRREGVITQYYFELENSSVPTANPEPQLDALHQCRAEMLDCPAN